jgi:malate/lactate dehydrogenase
MRTTSVGIVGAGNVGAALVAALAHVQPGGHAFIAARSSATADAAVLDAISASPDSPWSFQSGKRLEGSYDVVVITAGAQPAMELGDSDLLKRNLEIALASVGAISQLEHSVVVLVGTPVDRLTEAFCDARADLPPARVLGFGGELDRARLEYALRRCGLPFSSTNVIGEHGPNAIPVYDGSAPYSQVAEEIRSVLPRIKAATGKARNLASGTQLARLVSALTGKPQTMCVSRLDNRHGIALTWPCLIGSGGILEETMVNLGTEQRSALDALIDRRLRLRSSSRGR